MRALAEDCYRAALQYLAEQLGLERGFRVARVTWASGSRGVEYRVKYTCNLCGAEKATTIPGTVLEHPSKSKAVEDCSAMLTGHDCELKLAGDEP